MTKWLNLPSRYLKCERKGVKSDFPDMNEKTLSNITALGEGFTKKCIHFDETPCHNFKIDRDLTPEAWTRFAARAHIPEGMDSIVALENLHLLENGIMTHAGAWLLAEDITRYTLTAGVTCAVLRGTTNTHIIDLKNFTGDICSIYDDCIAYMQAKLNTALIPHAHGRDERLELPEDALREAMVNAIAHRDYRSTAKVQVHIFYDRLEIVTPGGLPAGMREEDLGIRSVPRNPLLFGMFHRMGMVEQIGSGIRRIRQECRDYGVEEPVIEVSDNWVVTTFKRQVEHNGPITPHVTEQVPYRYPTRPEQVKIRPESGPGSRPESLELRVLALLIEAPLSKSVIANSLGHRSVSAGLNKVIRALRKDGLIKYTIPEKPGSRLQKYQITETGRNRLAELVN